jgi:hypothetical protein
MRSLIRWLRMQSSFISRGRRRRVSAAAVVAAAIGFGVFMITNALAVHDLKFQLDGDPSTACGTVPDCTAQAYDWDSLFNADGTNTSVVNAVTGPFTNASFVRDFAVKTGRKTCSLTDTASKVFCTEDNTTYATGSKDTLNINPGWQCKHDNNVNSKIDIMNAYAAAYTDPTSGHKLLYFGLDKNKDNGNNNVGFWFLQGNANCEVGTEAEGEKIWSGSHQDGDVLVVSEFTSGGGVSGIAAYRWSGGASGCIDSNDNPDAKAGGCNGEPIGNGGDCKKATADDAICATTNSGTLAFNGNIETKWLTSDATLGVGHTVVPPDFFEGGVDLTKVFEKAGGSVPQCFNTFIGDTRSSQSLTATLFDFTRGVLGECKTTLATKAGDTENGGSASPGSIGTGKVSSGTDTANLKVIGTKTWGGTLSWYLCGPVSTDGCDRTKGVQVTSRTVSNSSPATDFVSGTAQLTSIGRYCWTAHFEPNAESAAAGVKAADDNGEGECFTVAPVTPTLETKASCSASPCVLGSALKDTATLKGTASQPGTNGGNSNYPSINATNGASADHSISWVLYSPKSGGCSDAKSTSPSSVAVEGDGTYGPTSYTTKVTDGIGTYTFVASYPGDGAGSNTNAATSTSCPDTTKTETVTVTGKATISSAQRWLPNDRVVVTGDANLNGKLTVTLYSGGKCEGTAVSGQKYETTFTEATSPQVFNTSNSTFFVGTKPDGTAGGAAGEYSWKVEYKDSNLENPESHCEKSTVSITD